MNDRLDAKYIALFNHVSIAIERLEDTVELLKCAQRQAEEEYLRQKEK